MQSWSEITHYAGFDWAHDHHAVVIVNPSGKIVADFQIEHTAEGWQRWLEQVAALGSGLAACVETRLYNNLLFLSAGTRIAPKPFRSDAIGSRRSVVAVADDVAVNVPHERGTGRIRELWPIRVI